MESTKSPKKCYKNRSLTTAGGKARVAHPLALCRRLGDGLADVAGVVTAVPGVEGQAGVERDQPLLGVAVATVEITLGDLAQQRGPALVQRVNQLQGDGGRGGGGIGQP